MSPFAYVEATDTAEAIRLARNARTKFLAGGTNLVDLMRETIESPDVLLDVTSLSSTVEERADGSLLIGAGIRNTALAAHPAVRARYQCLGVPIRLDAPKNVMVLREADFDLPFPSHNAELLDILTPALNAAFDERRLEDTLIDQVKVILKRTLATVRPSISRVARDLKAPRFVHW